MPARLRASHLWRRRFSTAPGPAAANSSSDVALEAAYRLVLGADSSQEIRIAPGQARAVASATAGFSVFLHMPTGAGKSLAFQVPALLAPHGTTTLVISPLIALMHDQVANLKRRGVDAAHVSADNTRISHKRKVPLRDVLMNKRLVYTTPEFLMRNRAMVEWVRSLGDRGGLERIVLDEAHCILEWGNSFRPSYLELCRWKARYFPDVPVTLATATVQEHDIPRLAELFRTQLVVTSAKGIELDSDAAARASRIVLVQAINDRPNLRLEVILKSRSDAAALIQSRVGNAPTIVYCLTRREAEEVCLALIRVGCRSGVYHGGVPRKRREFVRKQWMGGHISLICATSAFGMGIDRADVRFVVHHSIPLSLSAYYQQIGRAGRDAEPATCLLLYSAEDKARAHSISTEQFDEHDGTSLSNGASRVGVEEVATFCETTECRRAHISAHFGLEMATVCTRNCNCGPMEEYRIRWQGDSVELMSEYTDRTQEATSDDIPAEKEASTGVIEYYYQKILAEAKKQGLPKREALSRRLIREVLRAEPSGIEEMAQLRGIGSDKAARYYHIFSFR